MQRLLLHFATLQKYTMTDSHKFRAQKTVAEVLAEIKQCGTSLRFGSFWLINSWPVVCPSELTRTSLRLVEYNSFQCGIPSSHWYQRYTLAHKRHSSIQIAYQNHLLQLNTNSPKFSKKSQLKPTLLTQTKHNPNSYNCIHRPHLYLA